ncbi:MAG: hypothetical protein IJ529_00155 [Alphaproteobacteria bacterium]|nr:hypothetical protein [Alphaproteobacteria bacterium]MBQ9235119.1 hypothetical protein [Alphaproteobacteria bacterium]
MKSILSLCQEVADLAAVKRPESLFNSSLMSDNIFLSVAKSALDSLLRYGDWPELIKEGILLTSPRRKTYLISEICPDFYALLLDTIYIKDTHEKIIGAITPKDWMKSRYFYDNGTAIKFRLAHNAIQFLSLPDYPVKIVFQYRSSGICSDAKTFAVKSELTSDDDIPLFDPYLVKLGILWRWLKRNGMDYAEEYNEYELELKKKFAANYSLRDIPLDASADFPNEGVRLNVKVVC